MLLRPANLLNAMRNCCLVLAVLMLPVVHAADSAPLAIGLTADEQAYVERVGSIRMCVDPDWTPFEHINPQGRHEGIAADLVQLVASRVGLDIELYPVKTWEESLAASQGKHCQIMSFLNQTPARDQWLIFTQPIFSDANIIVTREEHPFIGDLAGIKGESVALPRGTMVEERVRRDYPGLRVILTNSEDESVSLVSAHQADMTIRSLMVAAYSIKKEGLFNLKIAGQIPEYTNRLRVGVLKDEPVLRNILDKAVGSISPQEREEISNRHVAIHVQPKPDYLTIWKIVAGATLLLLIAIYWNRKLSTLNRELVRLSVTDRLTGLFNRSKLDETFDIEIQRALRFGHTFSVIMLDIDYFKLVNDQFGHQVGDQVLVEVARLLAARRRETDILGRWGGEEFMLICPHTDADGAAILAETLRQAFVAGSFVQGLQLTASFGVSAFQSGDKATDIVARADAALYRAKHLGRNRVEVQ
ncbi:diguanylate cyclase [Quatrionicoccus australiensis]|uniref:diguanylate cyclase n=1 Tax=Quatrionicoccus australiensis TaxID=138118 RepID=UPI001CF8F8EF|nr:diguanylate cyclase [Quatrionicoccus australiensis]